MATGLCDSETMFGLCAQLHDCLASIPEVSREATGGRSRPECGLRETKDRLYEGTALAELRPRAPRTRLLPDGSYLADLGRACAGGSRAAKACAA